MFRQLTRKNTIVSLMSTMLVLSCVVPSQPSKQVTQATAPKPKQFTPEEEQKYNRLTSYLQSVRTVDHYPLSTSKTKYEASFPSKCEMELNVKTYGGRGPYYGGFTNDTTWHGGYGVVSDETYKVSLASVTIFYFNRLRTQDGKASIMVSYREWSYPLLDVYMQRGYWKEGERRESEILYTGKPPGQAFGDRRDTMLTQTFAELIELCRKGY